MSKKKSSKKSIKKLHLDKPTSHGGWPDGHSGSYRDPKTPVNKQLTKFLSDMGLLDDDNPRARLSEDKIRVRRVVLEGLLRKILLENNEDIFSIESLYNTSAFTTKSKKDWCELFENIFDSNESINLKNFSYRELYNIINTKTNTTDEGSFYENIYVSYLKNVKSVDATTITNLNNIDNNFPFADFYIGNIDDIKMLVRNPPGQETIDIPGEFIQVKGSMILLAAPQKTKNSNRYQDFIKAMFTKLTGTDCEQFDFNINFKFANISFDISTSYNSNLVLNEIDKEALSKLIHDATNSDDVNEDFKAIVDNHLPKKFGLNIIGEKDEEGDYHNLNNYSSSENDKNFLGDMYFCLTMYKEIIEKLINEPSTDIIQTIKEKLKQLKDTSSLDFIFDNMKSFLETKSEEDLKAISGVISDIINKANLRENITNSRTYTRQSFDIDKVKARHIKRIRKLFGVSYRNLFEKIRLEIVKYVLLDNDVSENDLEEFSKFALNKVNNKEAVEIIANNYYQSSISEIHKNYTLFNKASLKDILEKSLENENIRSTILRLPGGLYKHLSSDKDETDKNLLINLMTNDNMTFYEKSFKIGTANYNDDTKASLSKQLTSENITEKFKTETSFPYLTKIPRIEKAINYEREKNLKSVLLGSEQLASAYDEENISIGLSQQNHSLELSYDQFLNFVAKINKFFFSWHKNLEETIYSISLETNTTPSEFLSLIPQENRKKYVVSNVSNTTNNIIKLISQEFVSEEYIFPSIPKEEIDNDIISVIKMLKEIVIEYSSLRIEKYNITSDEAEKLDDNQKKFIMHFLVQEIQANLGLTRLINDLALDQSLQTEIDDALKSILFENDYIDKENAFKKLASLAIMLTIINIPGIPQLEKYRSKYLNYFKQFNLVFNKDVLEIEAPIELEKTTPSFKFVPQDNDETDDLPDVEDDEDIIDITALRRQQDDTEEEEQMIAESKLYRMVLKDLFEYLK